MGITDDMREARELHPPTIHPAKTPEGFPKHVSYELYEETAKDLADVAVSLLKSRMPAGLSTSTLRALAPLGMMVTAYGGRSLSIGFSPTVPKRYMHAALGQIGADVKPYSPLSVGDGGDYVFDIPDSIVPDFGKLSRINGIVIGATDGSYCRPEVVHPLVLAYACSPHNRPLVAAAIKGLIKDDRVGMPTTEMSKRRALDMIAQFAPDGFEYILQAARKYGVDDIHFALKEAHEKNRLFIDRWGV